LITRLSHIGDCIITTPVLNAIRDHFPQAYIAWIVEKPSDQLMLNHPGLDRLIVLSRGWLKQPKQVWKLRQELQELQFDTVIDPQSLTKSAILAWLSGANRRIGFVKNPGRELAPWLNNELVQPLKTHVLDRSLELLAPLGINSPQVRFDLPQDEAALEKMATFVDATHLAGGYAVLNPGAGWASRRWPAKRFGRVAKHLGQHRALTSVVAWAGEEERQWADEIVQRSGGHAIMAPKTNLKELSALLSGSRMYVGSDTGPMHIAVAMDTDCVVLYGTTRPQYSGAYGPQHLAVQAYFQSGTSRQRRSADNEAMRAIEVEAVCDACDRVLLRQQSQSDSSQAA